MTQLPWLDAQQLDFPSTDTALEEPNGLLAVGGDLSPARLLNAYRNGIFPWFDDDQPILWWSPSPRAVIFPERVYISKSMAKVLRKQELCTTADMKFDQVIRHCADTERPGQEGTWITDEMSDAYGELHRRGFAHSIEVWRGDALVGGLYGIAIGKVFFGESMFSLYANASKVAFISLCQQLQAWGYAVIDCQVSNPHLTSLGAVEIPRQQFNQLLKDNIDLSHYEALQKHSEKYQQQHWRDDWQNGRGVL